MMKLGNHMLAVWYLAAWLAAVGGCQKQEGPLEHAGKEIDQAIDKLSEPKAGPAEQIGQSVDHAADKAGQTLEKAGEQLQDAVARGDAK